MSRESGMSLITAVFLLVILAALGAFIASLGAVQQKSSANDIQGSRALYAARAGLDWGAYQATTAPVLTCVAQTVLALPAGFGEFRTVTVSCTSSPHTEGLTLKTFYMLTANACNMPGAGGVCPNTAPPADYVERELQLSVINPP
jgi:MSHA biogenesis protein MshP